MITTISWPHAFQELAQLLPGCQNFLPDEIAEAAAKAGYLSQFIPLHEWETMTDDDIFQRIMPAKQDVFETILIVTDASFIKAGPFLLQIGDLLEFAKLHIAQFKENVFNGDVVIVLGANKKIVLFHHSGFYTLLNFGQIATQETSNRQAE